ncbi:MAG: tyrosine--tRNA ligase [bacterium]
MTYDFQTLKEAILFNTVEVLPTDEKQLDQEIQVLVDQANKSGQPIRHYIGFEISGQIHFPGGVYQMLNIARLQAAGVECIIWLADYHTWINKKLDGKIETIRQVAHQYFEPILKKCLEAAGGDPEKLVFLYAQDEYFKKNSKGLSFWDYEFEVEKNITLSRILRSLSITGKEAGESVDYQVTRYPGMQAADVFWHQTHIVQAGLDQRKIYVLARDHAKDLDTDFQLSIGDQKVKPIIFFNELLLGLETPKIDSDVNFETSKMSKSKPDSAVWVHDSLEEITRKLRKAYAPMFEEGQSKEEIEAIQKFNPLLDWSKKMIFPAGKTISVERPEKFGGNKDYNTFKELQDDYFAGNLHPLDLKNAAAKTLANWFAPIREWVEANPAGLELVKSVKK